nr:hypothetical protein Itr_chr15CG13770 [Ipomoea trifida]
MARSGGISPMFSLFGKQSAVSDETPAAGFRLFSSLSFPWRRRQKMEALQQGSGGVPCSPVLGELRVTNEDGEAASSVRR